MTTRPLWRNTQIIEISTSSTLIQIHNHNFSSSTWIRLRDIVLRRTSFRIRETVFPRVRAGPKDLIPHRLQTSIIFNNTIRTIVTISIKVRNYFSKDYRKYQQHKAVSNSNNKCSRHSYTKHRSKTLEWLITSLHHLNSFHHAITIVNIKQLRTLLSTDIHFKYNKWTLIITT